MTTSRARTGLEGGIRVVAPARLHLGFLDPTGTFGRRFFGLGLAIEAPVTELRVCRARGDDRVVGTERGRIARLLRALRTVLPLPPVAVQVVRAIPPHAGFGSGTQLALALAVALTRLLGRDEPLELLAQHTGRGRRSGLGVAAFAHGGFLFDAGRGHDGRPPPLLVRLPVPESWRILLLRDPAREGLSGAAEERAFRDLPPFPEAVADRLARLALSCVLPGLVTADLALFGQGLGEIQDRLGDWYAPFQEAGRWASPEVGRALEHLRALGIRASGQSSWGPTGFAVVHAREADELARELARSLPALVVEVVRPRNRGARVEPGVTALAGAPAADDIAAGTKRRPRCGAAAGER